MEPENRNLTDDDVKAIVTEIRTQLEREAGRGIIGLIWKFALLGFLLLAAYGALKGGNIS